MFVRRAACRLIDEGIAASVHAALSLAQIRSPATLAIPVSPENISIFLNDLFFKFYVRLSTTCVSTCGFSI